MWGDIDRTHPVWHGPVARSTIQAPAGDQVPQTFPDTPGNDVSHNARGTQLLGVPGETNLGKDWILQINNSSWGKAEDASADKNVLYAKPKFSTGKTIANKAYVTGSILQLIEQADPGNKAGAIPSALKVQTGLKQILDAAALTSSGGGAAAGGAGGGGGILNQILAITGQGGGTGGQIASQLIALFTGLAGAFGGLLDDGNKNEGVMAAMESVFQGLTAGPQIVNQEQTGGGAGGGTGAGGGGGTGTGAGGGGTGAGA